MKLRLPVRKVIFIVVLLFLIFVLLGCLLPPLFQKKVGNEYKASFSADLSAEDLTKKERILCIDDNEEALIWRLRTIEAAEDEIILSTFDFGNDNSGLDMMSALARAADRGVHIRLFIDGINGMLKLSNSSYFKALVALPNVEAKFYNPVNLMNPWKLNYRMHDKYLIADNRIYILGGRNTNDLFLGNYRNKYNIDRDILVYHAKPEENSSLKQLRKYFDSIWDLPCSHEIMGSGNSKKVQAAVGYLRDHYEDVQQMYPQAFEKTDWEEATMEAESISLCMNSMEPQNKAPELWYSLYQYMRQGKDVIIQTPYIICSKDMYEEIAGLCGNGTRLQIVTNAVENGANPWGCTDYLNQKNEILDTGAEVHEVFSDQSLHTKTILIDDNISIVGSYNLDIRSTYLDTEMMLVIESPALNEYLRERTKEQMEQSKHVLPDGTETYGKNYSEIEMSFGKKCFYAVLRVIVYPFRYLL